MTGSNNERHTTLGGPYEVKVTLWHEGEDDRKKRVVEGFYNENSPVDCVNALIYDLRGEKSAWELAYVNEINPVEDGDE